MYHPFLKKFLVNNQYTIQKLIIKIAINKFNLIQCTVNGKTTQ